LNVIAENCLRFEEGKPLVKLLFFIGLDANTRNKKIDLNLVVNGKGFDCITNRELRVLYKVYSDYGPEVAGIVNKTVVFVRLHEINDKECEYTLDVLPKIWEDPSWDDLWKNRLRNHHGDCTATRTWAAFFMPYLNRANLTFAESPARKSRLF
jgi:hypothetical protein